MSRNKRSHRDTTTTNSDTTLSTGCGNSRNKRSRLDNQNTARATNSNNNKAVVKSLLDISAKCVARQYPYQEIEERLGHIPLPVQTRITYHSFPENESSIELYSSNSLHMSHTESNKQPFNVGKKLYETDAVKDVIQIGKSFYSYLVFFSLFWIQTVHLIADRSNTLIINFLGPLVLYVLQWFIIARSQKKHFLSYFSKLFIGTDTRISLS